MSDLQSIVGWAPANLNMLPWDKFAQASDFSTTYLLTGASITSGVTSPSGLTNAQKLVENSSGGNHLVYSFFNPSCASNSQTVFRVAAIAKAAERTRIVLVCEYGDTSKISARVGFDLIGGNVGYDTTTGSQTTVIDNAMTDLGGGWWLCTFDFKYTGAFFDSTTMQTWIYLDNGSGTAARSISYNGNGSSGADIWWLNLLPKAAWNLNALSFYDDFTTLDTIDLGNTLAPGFKWYINNRAPNSIAPSWWGNDVLPVSTPENFTISSPSILKIYDGTGGAPKWGSMMYSVCFPDSGGYVGTAWQAPVIWDGYFSWDGSKDYADHSFLGPAFWGHTVEAMTGEIGPSGHWIEWDAIDIGGTTGGTFDHILIDGLPGEFARNTWDPHSTVAVNMHEGTFHRISGLWLSAASNDGIGLQMSFFNGQMIPYTDMAYYSGAVPQPPGSNPINSFYAADAQHIPIMIDTGPGWPMFIDWVKVYTSGSTPTRFRHSKIGTRHGSRQMAQ
jgi:hypothetical protein